MSVYQQDSMAQSVSENLGYVKFTSLHNRNVRLKSLLFKFKLKSLIFKSSNTFYKFPTI